MAQPASDILASMAADLQNMNQGQRQQFYQALVANLEQRATNEPRALLVYMQRSEYDAEPTAEASENGVVSEDADHDPVAEGAAAEAEEEQEEEEEEDVIEVDTGEDDEDEEDEPDAAPSRKRNPGDVHFSVLLDKGVIRPGHFMMVPHKTMRGVYASMIYITRERRVSEWRVTCEALNIDRAPLRGTGPMAWIPALAALGFQAVSISAWSKDVRVYSAGVDIGGITELKGLYG